MDNATLRELVTRRREAQGAWFASVYYDSTHATEDAQTVLELTWRELREQLESNGASAETVSALDEAIADTPPPAGRRGRALIAMNGAVLLDAELAQPPPQPIARWSELPYLVPYAANAEPAVAHVVASVDKVGAEVSGVDARGRLAEQHTVVGSEHPVHEVGSQGGLPRRHINEHVQETVKQNLTKVADDVTAVADRVHATLIVVSGEVKGRRELRSLLPDRLQQLTVDLGARGKKSGTEDDKLTTEVNGLLSEEQHKLTESVIERFQAEAGRGSDGLMCQGLADTCAALREASVEALLIGEDGDHLVEAGTDAIEIAVDTDELDKLSISPITRRRADEALPFAAIAVGADLVYTGTELALADGFGALLRYRGATG